MSPWLEKILQLHTIDLESELAYLRKWEWRLDPEAYAQAVREIEEELERRRKLAEAWAASGTARADLNSARLGVPQVAPVGRSCRGEAGALGDNGGLWPRFSHGVTPRRDPGSPGESHIRRDHPMKTRTRGRARKSRTSSRRHDVTPRSPWRPIRGDVGRRRLPHPRPLLDPQQHRLGSVEA
jgi:hypothetical protein